MTARPFLVIGSMKSGTATLETLLREHPDVDVVTEKETLSFADPQAAARTAEAIARSPRHAAGEVATGYMQQPLVDADPALARELLGPELRILAVVRDPYVRALSHWRHWEQLGRNASGPIERLLLDPDGPYVAFSSYHRQLSPWLSVVDRDHVQVLRLEDYRSDPAAWTGRVWSALGVAAPVREADVVHANQADTRVVTAGIGRGVGQSAAYRRFVRPLVPTALRRAGARLLGGQRGGGGLPPLPEDLRARFYDLLAADLDALREELPELTWARGAS